MNNELTELTYRIYQYYYNIKIKNKTGKLPHLIKNWDKIKTKEEWPYIQQFAERVLKSNGQINYKLYIQALFDFSNNQWFSPKLFTSLKGIEIYKHFIKTINDTQDPIKLWDGIINSIKFIIDFCHKNKIKTWADYFYMNCNTFPTIVLHYNSGSISKPFFVLIPNIVNKILKGFPEDIQLDFFPKEQLMSFESDKLIYMNKSDKIRKLALNFEAILDYYIQK